MSIVPRSREGFTLDFVARSLSTTVLHPVLTSMLAILAGSELPALGPITEKIASIFPHYRLGLYLTAGTGLAIWGNNVLNKWSANNWTRDPTWDFNKEIVLVTGGSGGIGTSIIRHLLAKNINTTIVVIDYVPLTWTPPEGSRVHYYQCDLSNPDQLRDVSALVKSQVGHPTVLINNAGVMRGHTLLEGTYEDTSLTIRTNLVAPFLLLQEFLPDMVANNHGHVVSVGSISSAVALPRLADYAATKAGLATLSEALRYELGICYGAPRVRVSIAQPCFVRTAMVQGEVGWNHFLLPFLHVDSVGERLAEVVASGYAENVYMPGMMRYVASLLSGGPTWLQQSLIGNSARTTTIVLKSTNEKQIDPKTGFLAK
ncbi:unnamed protein product [Clonostachys byssicola]|uniref:Ketoreductase domain-containing protein n=1 Tax=Clonostachys byssicola TaxID=160290 RepID=A0A9N9V1M2_9HYPO|nr:unnamed protein product [Clonostachys byssicola]